LGPSGGPITKDNTGVEYYCTIFALTEDHFEAGTIWAGSDDGLIHITRDGGATWTDVTPRDVPEWIQINSIEADPHRAGGAYVAATMYKSDDFRPYLYRTEDFGRSWTKIVRGIEEQHFTRVLRADPQRPGLLYAGTESGLYVSFDDGAQWHRFQLNLPIVPITDLAVKDGDLVVATQGRSFWVLDDLSVLHQLSPDILSSRYWLFAPRPSWRLSGAGGRGGSEHNGENLPRGVLVHYRFAESPDSAAVALRILGADGEVIRTFRPLAEEETDRMSIDEGLNRLVWDLRYPDAEDFEGMVMWWGSLHGPRVVPGHYQVRLVVKSDSTKADFELRQDPRSTASPAELQAQFDVLLGIRDQLTEAHASIARIRRVREQIEAALERAQGSDAEEALEDAAETLLTSLKTIEEALYQTRNRSRQDPLNYPIRLTNKLAHLAWTISVGDQRPTDQALQVREELGAAIDAELGRLEQLLSEELPRFNRQVVELNVPAVHTSQP
jgi:hypothetical protein